MVISIRDTILLHTGESLEEGARKIGVGWIELSLGREKEVYSPQGEKVILSSDRLPLWKNSSLKIFAVLLNNDFLQEWEKEREYILSAVELARELGIGVIRLDPLIREEGKEKKERIKEKIVDSLKRILDSINTDIKFGLENHGIMANDPYFLKDIVESVGDDRLGFTLDTANFYWSGKPLSQVYQIIEDLAPQTFHVHAKNIAYPPELREKPRPPGYEYSRYSASLYEGDIDMRKVVKTLHSAGYEGDLCIENESLHRYEEKGRVNILRKEVNYLKEILNNLP